VYPLDKTRITEFKVSYMGHPPVSIRHTLCPPKGDQSQALEDFLAAHPVSESSKLHKDIPDEVFGSNITSKDEMWQMFFDGVSRTGPNGKIIAGMGVVFVSPKIISFLGPFY